MTKRNPTVVIDLELTQPLPDRRDLSPHADALVVCRMRGTPIAAVRVPIDGGQLATDVLVRELLDAHAWAFAVPLAERALAAGRLPGWIDVESLLTATIHGLASGPLATVAVYGEPGDPSTGECVASIQSLDYRNVELMFVSADDAGRRRAVRDARGDIVVFVDRAAVLDRQWLSRVVAVFLADPEVMAVTGLSLPRVIDEPLIPTLVRQWYRRGAFPSGTEGTVAYWRTAAAALPRVDVDAMLAAGHTVVYEPSALTWGITAGRDAASSPAVFLRMREAVRAVDLAEPLRPIADATHEDRVRLMVSWHGVPLGTAHIAHYGAVISPLWQTDAITQQLAAELLDARVQLGRRVVWAHIVSGLARALGPNARATTPRRTAGDAAGSAARTERARRATGQAA